MPSAVTKIEKVNLFYLSGNTTGGWVTYTKHLTTALEKNGVAFNLYKVGNNTEKKDRNFGYGLDYRNLSQKDANDKCHEAPTVIVALQKNYIDKCVPLITNGSAMVVHDPAEFNNVFKKAGVPADRCITIRKAVRKQLPGSHLVLHPYQRANIPKEKVNRDVVATSICRIDFDKNTHILLDANRLLPASKKIQIHGFENRLYTKFKIVPKYPEWDQSKAHYPRETLAAYDICRRAVLTVDMSIIKGDGGGTQYSFLEAMDAGSICVLHSDWILDNDEMIPWPNTGANCLTVSSGEELAKLIKGYGHVDSASVLVRANASLLLEKHDAKKIGAKFLNVLQEINNA